MRRIHGWSLFCRLLTCALCSSGACFAANVTTHHYDNFRSGWNWQETTLTPALLQSGSIAKLATVALDEQVDAQPLVLTNQTVNGTLYSTVVYVATENNSVYAINATTGAVLAQTHLETAVAMSGIFGGSCQNNSGYVGINSTPVIDAARGTLYVVTATVSTPNTVTFNLHALDVGTLADKAAPLTIANPSATSYNRQRSALTLFNGGVLIAFSSFCDKLPSLGFITYANMLSSPAAQVAFQTSSTKLASIWMSGGGPAVTGNSIFFSTGNGQGPYPPAGPPNTNLPESLVGLRGSAGVPLSLTFAALFSAPNASSLDQNDNDLGSGNVLIIPAGAPASIVDGTTPPQFVTAVGKEGNLFVNNPGLGSSYVQELNVGGNCSCVYSYFTGADGLGHIAIEVNSSLNVYDVSASGLTLLKSYGYTGWPATGAFTTISSNGTAAGTAVLWVASVTNTNLVGLTAFDPAAANFVPVFSSYSTGGAGSWPYYFGNGNIVPVVANGHVFVASYKQLDIFGQTNVATDAGTFTATQLTFTGGADKGYKVPGVTANTYNPATLTGGWTVAQFYDTTKTTRSLLSVSGFTTNPGLGWLLSISANGTTKTGASAIGYTYSLGTATWGWIGIFGLPGSGTDSAVITHQY
jgi:hypothetical protein